MLRTAVLIFGCLVLLLGAGLCTLGVGFGGVQTLIVGAIFVLGTLFERWRYNNKNAPVDADWQATGERFVNPESGKQMEVFYDARSGERQYREITQKPV
jgi:hypothetical protein